MLDKSSTSGLPESNIKHPASIARRGAIILCGGASLRMGRNKAWLPFGPDEVMLQRVVRLVGDAVPKEQVVCVAAAGKELPRLPDDVSVVRDRNEFEGPLAGLAVGLTEIKPRAEVVFVTGCDAPLLQPALISRLIELLSDHQIAAIRDGARFHPLTAVYRVDVLEDCELLLAAGERSLISLVERCRTLRVQPESIRDVDPNLTSLANCNTETEYRSLLKLAGF